MGELGTSDADGNERLKGNRFASHALLRAQMKSRPPNADQLN